MSSPLMSFTGPWAARDSDPLETNTTFTNAAQRLGGGRRAQEEGTDKVVVEPFKDGILLQGNICCHDTPKH